jgi:hypothetical protein
MDELEEVADGLHDLDVEAPAASPLSSDQLRFFIERAMREETTREFIAESVKRQLPGLINDLLSRRAFREFVRTEITRILAGRK